MTAHDGPFRRRRGGADTLPSLCFGLFGPLGRGSLAGSGTERALLLVLVILAVGTGLRGVATVPALFAGQILAGFSIGIVNVLLPSLVKRDFPETRGIDDRPLHDVAQPWRRHRGGRNGADCPCIRRIVGHRARPLGGSGGNCRGDLGAASSAGNKRPSPRRFQSDRAME